MTDFKPIQPLPEGFSIRKFDPYSSNGYKSVLQLTELLFDTFQVDGGFFSYWLARNRMIGSTWQDVCEEKAETQDRLDAYKSRAESLGITMHGFARSMHMSMLRGNVAGGLYETKLFNGQPSDQLAGVYIWRYPPGMVPPRTLYQQLVYSWFKFKYAVIRRWNSFWYTSTTRNFVFAQLTHAIHEADPVPTSQDEVDRLAQLTYDELVTEPYPEKDMVYLSWFYVARHLQGRGLGKNLFQYAIDAVPKTKASFVSRDGKFRSEGPQKQFIIASPEGRPLYRKFGFDDGVSIEYIPEADDVPDDFECIRWRQLRTVD